MDDADWCMRWSSEVLPEPAMIPDRSIFLRAASASSQVVTTSRQNSHTSMLSKHQANLFKDTPWEGPLLLKLPFILSLPVEDSALMAEQPDALLERRPRGEEG